MTSVLEAALLTTAFGELIRAIRESRKETQGITLYVLASETGFTIKTIQRWEEGKCHPQNVHRVERLAVALAVSPSDLVAFWTYSRALSKGQPSAEEIDRALNAKRRLLRQAVGQSIVGRTLLKGLLSHEDWRDLQRSERNPGPSIVERIAAEPREWMYPIERILTAILWPAGEHTEPEETEQALRLLTHLAERSPPGPTDEAVVRRERIRAALHSEIHTNPFNRHSHRELRAGPKEMLARQLVEAENRELIGTLRAASANYDPETMDWAEGLAHGLSSMITPDLPARKLEQALGFPYGTDLRQMFLASVSEE